MFKKNMKIADYDPILWQAIVDENRRQEEHIELIASENYASPRVMEAQGSQFTNKYAEGYPGKRYYGGCEYADIVEQLAIDRAKELFGADYVNVQPHSGSQANAAVYMALLEPHDTILGMSLAHGGHLTHGASVSFSGKIYKAAQYGITDDGFIDYDALRKQAHVAGLVAAGMYPNPLPHAHIVTTTTHKTLGGPRGGLILSSAKDEELYKKLQSAVFPAGQGGPLVHVIAAKAVCFKEALEPEYKIYQQNVLKNAKAMVEVFKQRGFDVVSNGTENHLFLVSFVKQGLTGKAADAALGRANITVNKNSVPNDPQKPFVTSGIRIGTPAVTRRGFTESDVRDLAGWMCDVLDSIGKDNHEDVIAATKAKVLEICKRLPVYA